MRHNRPGLGGLVSVTEQALGALAAVRGTGGRGARGAAELGVLGGWARCSGLRRLTAGGEQEAVRVGSSWACVAKGSSPPGSGLSSHLSLFLYVKVLT